MNVFGFNIQITRPRSDDRSPIASAQRSFSPESWLAGEDIDRGGALLCSAYEQVVWVYRAINALAEQVANVPFVFSSGERGRENLITSGPLLDFYARPRAQLNRFQYWELRVMWLMLRGECMRVPIWDSPLRTPKSARGGSPLPSDGRGVRGEGRRVLKSIVILDPARFQHIVEDHRLIGWRYTGFGPRAPLASQVFLPEEVWFEKLPNPFDFWRGFPPLYVAGTAAQTDFAAGAFMRGIIENNADTGVIVRTDKWLSDEQREQILAALKDRKRRAGSADRPVLLLGSAEVLRPQLSSSDLQFLDNRKFSRAEICAAFGVPEEIVTSTEHAKYDVMTGARLNFIENRVAPLCSRLEAEEDVTIKSIDPGASGWFDLDSLPIMQEARRSRLAAARTGFQMGVPFNELNRVLDLGFRPLPWGDRGYLPATLQDLGSANTEGGNKAEGGDKAEGRNPKAEGSPKSEIRNSNPAADQESALARAECLLSQLSNYQLSAIDDRPPSDHPLPGQGYPASTTDHQLLRRFRRFLFEQRGRVLEKLSGIRPAPEIAGTARKTPAELLNSIFDLERENLELQRRVGLGASTEPVADSSQLAKVNDGLRSALLSTLHQGISSGETDLIGRVKAFYNQVSPQQLMDSGKPS